MVQPIIAQQSSPTDMTVAFTDGQIRHIKKYSRVRLTYKTPTVLIVEDQDFSRKLLEGLLSKSYPYYSAATASQAIALYAEHLPSIVFLDIELPDMSGHDVAALIKLHDPASFVVMVTANHYEEDVVRARKNNVQGFIVKPYSRQKIHEYIEKCSRKNQL